MTQNPPPAPHGPVPDSGVPHAPPPVPTGLRDSARALALALGVGISGGVVFLVLHLPLPWMLGAMAAVTVVALAGLRPAVPKRLRLGMLAVLGVMLGSAFAPGMLDDLAAWAPSLGVLLAVSVVTPFLAGQIFRRFGRTDRVTAYFSGTPGGLNEMVTMGTALGGDERTIALVHALRILIVVFAVALWIQGAHGGVVPGVGGAGSPSLLAGDIRISELGWLALAAVAGVPVGMALRLPAPVLTGPMIVAGGLQVTAVTDLRPPGELLAAAQVVVGSALGARFVGTTARSLMRTAVLSVGSSAVMLALAAGAAGAMAAGSGLPFLVLLLAYVPGGVAEMSLIALALGADVPFVATHHTARIALVIALAPLFFRLWRRWDR